MTENIYKRLLEELNSGKKAIIVTILNNRECDGKNFNKKLLITEEILLTNNSIPEFNQMVYDKSKYALETGTLQFIKASENQTYLIEPYFPQPRLIVLGGGHIAKPLAEFGSKAGYSVTVVDDRPSFANSKRFATADEVICESFEKCFDLLNINKSAFVVIITRGHRHDMDCLKQVLNHNTAYVGMIGSKRRVKGAMEQLLNEGYSKEKLDKVNSPIGLEIGAVTPEEIAFSIIAQVIKYRRLTNTINDSDSLSKSTWPDFDKDVLMELSTEDDSPKAIVTIISTKGSVPRKAGAKMIVYPSGKISGSIGGGCSEGEVINNARYLLRTGGYQFQTVDMTGDVAEDIGMVCGGIMEVIIEYFDR
jgi:xanthine dehydrogenase accessory factor